MASDDGDSASDFDYRSVSTSVLEYEVENGRTYHAYRAGKYHAPNDEKEQNRLDLQHAMFTKLFGDNLSLAPIDTIPLREVLDIATGTGIWAIEFAEQHPEANVTGTDLSPIQPNYVPPNVTFEVNDAEDLPWIFPHSFSYIHARAVISCFTDPANIFREAYNALAPGGLIEFQDPVMPFQYATEPKPTAENSAFVRWNELSGEAAIAGGRSWNNVPLYKKMMEEAGFVDVTERWFVLHMGQWSEREGADGEREQELGRWMTKNWLEAIEGMSIRNLARIGWSVAEVTVLCAQVRKEMLEEKWKPYADILAVWGRKPADSAAVDGTNIA